MAKFLDIENYIIAFDLDGTLVNTDKANSMAYQRSVYDVSGITIDIDNCRITRDSLNNRINVSDNILQEIIVKKKKIVYRILSLHTTFTCSFYIATPKKHAQCVVDIR